MARFCTLCSSSGGNSAYIGDGESGILIDAGISCKQLKNAMTELNIRHESIRAIFVTHEHSDHVNGIRVLASSLHIPVFATPGTLAGMNNMGIMNGKFEYGLLTSAGVALDNMRITPFPTSHDAKQSCGYRVDLPDVSIGIATDTGKMTDEIFNQLRECKLVLIESNYDEEMLDFGPYPPPLKSRIRSSLGHLSNSDCADTVSQLLENGVRHFVLGHLSRENNTPDLAFRATFQALSRLGATKGVDYTLTVAPVLRMDKMIYV